MDSTETYIKMCEKATEIQSQWRDAAYQRRGAGYGSLIYYYDEANKHYRLDMFLEFYMFQGRPTTQVISLPSKYNIGQAYAGLIWQCDLSKVIFLPLQDQLQEMWLEHKPTACPAGGFHFLLQDWIMPNIDYANKMLSMEQLWLAFVMHEKYGKAWNGEEWVKLNG